MNTTSQNEFALALANPQASVPFAAQQQYAAFAVYRNNVSSARTEALQSAYPAIEQLLGTEFFSAMSADFIREHPPRSPVLHEYGEALAEFFEHYTPLQDFPYLADVARIEWARRCAFHAADAAPMQLPTTTAATAINLLHTFLRWHPSLHLLHSTHPAGQLWASQLEGADPPRADDWRAESVLVSRRGWRVEVQVIDPVSAELLQSLQSGGRVAEVAPHINATVIELAEALGKLLRLGALIAAEQNHPNKHEHHNEEPS